jgi:hypothetical protein
MKAITKKYWYAAMVAGGYKDADQFMKNLGYYIQPLDDIHLNPDIDDGLSHGDRRYIWLFGAVAGFILMLACINFINLSTARSAGRAKEVGLRKVTEVPKVTNEEERGEAAPTKFWLAARGAGAAIPAGVSFFLSFSLPACARIKGQHKPMGWKNPIGQKITNGGTGTPVIGVVEDFNYELVKQDVGPLCMHLGSWSTIVAVKANTADIPGLIAGINGVWKGFSPQQTLRYTFLDERFARMYDDVRRTGNIFTSLATLAVIIACLGLFALSAFMAEQRRKEMGIRKVLGATVMQVMRILSADFLRLVLIAFVIASPIAYLGMNKWLQDYVYRINIGIWMFAGAAALVTLIALATISVQALRAATANPVEALRMGE